MKLNIEVSELPDGHTAQAYLRSFIETFERLEAAREAALGGNGAAEASQTRPETPPAKPKKAKKAETPPAVSKIEQPELPIAMPEDDLRERLRLFCRKQGVVRLRPAELEKYGVKQLATSGAADLPGLPAVATSCSVPRVHPCRRSGFRHLSAYPLTRRRRNSRWLRCK